MEITAKTHQKTCKRVFVGCKQET